MPHLFESPRADAVDFSLSLKVATFVISHVTTWNDIVARTALLRILSGLTEPAKGALLIPVLAETVQATHKQRTELFEGVSNDTLLEYSRLLLQPYEGASRKWLDSTETKALAVFCDALEIKDVTGSFSLSFYPVPLLTLSSCAGAGAILRKEAFVIVRTSIFASIRGENRLDLFKRLIRLAVVPESVSCLLHPTRRIGLTGYFSATRSRYCRLSARMRRRLDYDHCIPQ